MAITLRTTWMTWTVSHGVRGETGSGHCSSSIYSQTKVAVGRWNLEDQTWMKPNSSSQLRRKACHLVVSQL